MARSAANTDMAFLTSILSAYLVVAYFAGKNLTIFQLISISTLYTGFYFYSSYGFFYTVQTAFGAAAQQGNEISFNVVTPMFIFLGIAWAISIAFMVQARRHK